MKFFSWLACHLILLIVILSAAMAWTFRQELASDFARLTGKIADNNAVSSPADQRQLEPLSDVATAPLQTQPAQDVYRTAPIRTVSSPTAAVILPTRKPPTDEIPGNSNMRQAETASTAVDARILNPAYERQAPAAPDVQSRTQFPPDDYDPEVAATSAETTRLHYPYAELHQAASIAESATRASRFPPLLDGDDDLVMGEAVPGVTPASAATDSPVNAPSLQQPVSEYQQQLNQARSLLWDGRQDRARQAYERMMRDYPANPEVAAELGNLLMQLDRSQEASAVYDAAIDLYRRQQRDEEAIGLIRFISRYNPSLADILYNKNWQ